MLYHFYFIRNGKLLCISLHVTFDTNTGVSQRPKCCIFRKYNFSALMMNCFCVMCGEGERGQGPFSRVGSPVPSCSLERRAARWAQGAPSSSRPVPRPPAPSLSYAERHTQQQHRCHCRTFPMSQLSPWSLPPHPAHSSPRVLGRWQPCPARREREKRIAWF